MGTHAPPCIFTVTCLYDKNSNMKRTGQTVTPSVLADRSKAKVVPSLFPKSSNSCPGYPSPHVAQGRARLEQVKIIKEDCLLETPIIFVGIDVCKAQLDVAIRPTAQTLSVTNDKAGIKTLIKHLAETSSPTWLSWNPPVVLSVRSCSL